jgi:uracil DNA glycosylase
MKRNSGWQSILRSAECCDVLAQVAALRKKGERVYPIQKDVFRAFEDCPFKKVRVVILGQDPYPNEGQAIGRAFAVSESTTVPPSLKNIFKEVCALARGGVSIATYPAQFDLRNTHVRSWKGEDDGKPHRGDGAIV